MARGLVATALVVGALAVAGCGGDDASDDAAPPADSGQPAQQQEEKAAGQEPGGDGTVVKLASSDFGDIVSDDRGQALYLFDKEQDGESECYGACAEAWPPLLTEGEPVAGEGTDQSLLGTTKRRDGKLQVTYDGQPLYYYVDDEPGVVLCHGVPEFGGTWLVLGGDGAAVET